MIVNTDIPRLLKPPPNIDARWRGKIADWLGTGFGNGFDAVFRLQLTLVEEITEIEAAITGIRSHSKALGMEIPLLKANGELEAVKQAQEKVTALSQQAEQLKYLRECILLVGDHIAARSLDPDTIRRFSNFQPPGFLSGKNGLKREIEAARQFFDQGYMVILNDLTHSLRVGDLTLKKGSEVRTVEIKSNIQGYRSKEAMRQTIIPSVVHNYIRSDVITRPHRISGEPDVVKFGFRLDSDVKENWNCAIAGQVHKGLQKADVAHLIVGRKQYLAARRKDLAKMGLALSALTSEGDWVVSNVQRRVVEYAEVSPFTQWFKLDSAIDIMTGDLVVLSAFKMADLELLFAAKGLKLVWKRKMTDLFPIRLEGEQVSAGAFQHKTENMGDHHRLKVMYAFLAVESYVDIIAFLLSPEAAEQARTKLARFLPEPKSTNEESPPEDVSDSGNST